MRAPRSESMTFVITLVFVSTFLLIPLANGLLTSSVTSSDNNILANTYGITVGDNIDAIKESDGSILIKNENSTDDNITADGTTSDFNMGIRPQGGFYIKIILSGIKGSSSDCSISLIQNGDEIPIYFGKNGTYYLYYDSNKKIVSHTTIPSKNEDYIGYNTTDQLTFHVKAKISGGQGHSVTMELHVIFNQNNIGS